MKFVIGWNNPARQDHSGFDYLCEVDANSAQEAVQKATELYPPKGWDVYMAFNNLKDMQNGTEASSCPPPVKGEIK